MKTNVGVWIDHRKAIIVTLTGHKRVETHLTISAVEKQLRRTGSSPLRGAFDDHQVPADGVRTRAFVNHLNSYYDAVLAGLGKADSILVVGPGEAKRELLKRMKRSRLDTRLADIRAADKMTSRQLELDVLKYFSERAAG